MGCWCNGTCPNIGRAHALAKAKRFGRAEIELRRVLVRAPLCVEANLMLAQALTASNRGAFAEVHLSRALGADMTAGQALMVAQNFRSQAKIPEAIVAFEAALSLDGTNPHAHAGLIGALEAAGELDAAMAEIEAASKRFAMQGALRRVAALVFAARKDFAGAIALLSVDDIAPIELLDRGRYREKIGQYPGAWSDWMRAKTHLREKAGHVYKREPMDKLAADLIDVSQPAWRKFIIAADRNEAFPQPIFITGFPRSGTTMLEATLAAHGAVKAGDELMFISEVSRLLPRWARARMPYPAALLATSQGENEIIPALLRDYYLRKAGRRIGFGPPNPPRFFTDKMPLNEWHLPLIHCLFPRSPVLHIRRHPLDVIVSCMSHFLTHGGHFACSPETAAYHIALVDSVVTQHKKHLPPGAIFRDVKYETLTADHRGETDSILAAIGLPPDPACYDFHLGEWNSRTISYRQIKEPVHGASVGRWKNFAQFLAPLYDTLRPIIEREGYEL